MTMRADVQGFFDADTNTVSYLVSEPGGPAAAIIDPVLNYDHASGTFTKSGAQAILDAAAARGLTIRWILETHAHADHLSAAPFIKSKTGAPVAIGEHITDVQQIFSTVFDATDVSRSGAEFDRLFTDGETFDIGTLTARVIHTPGHTPACVSYQIGDAVFVGDTLFMPDYGTARADFPGGDAGTLYQSIHKLLALPPETRLFVCHDYLPADGRDIHAWETTVAAQRTGNVHVHDGVAQADFVRMRHTRDKSLAAPALLLPSVQVNIRAGHLPPASPNGTNYLRIPIKPAA
ncbi:MBL fold metallo-hydrolase [Pyruvatibacter sp.]|uniref:MBL fold metallo-hydrolase n=1 Tax=Pyruvatibacter sp. TaxID=1981328 RepID=UPI0032EDEE04